MGSSRGVFSNCAEFVGLLSRLEIVMVKIENWMILQRSVFDITVNGEPFPALQLYFNIKTGTYLTRVWGRTHSKGEILANDVTEFELLCNEMFAQGLACCPGQTAKDGEDEGLISVKYPFQRKVSAGCAIVHLQNNDVHDGVSVAICVECKSNENTKIQIKEEDLCTNLYPDVKVTEIPEEYLMDDSNDIDEDALKVEHGPDVEEDSMEVINDVEEEESKGDPDWVPSLPPKQSSRRKSQSMVNNIKISKVESEQAMPGEKDENKETTKDLIDLKRVDTREKSFACQHCSYKGATNELLYHHKRGRHRAEFDEERREKKRARGTFVPQTYRELRGSRRIPDLWIHSSTDKFECEHCGMQLSRNLKGIARHYRRQHLWGNFFCGWCKFFAYYPIEYASHMLDRHSDMEGGVTAQCAECGEEVHLNGNVKALAEHYKECAVAAENLKRKLLMESKKKEEDMKDTTLISARSVCQVCGKYIKQTFMQQHLRRHKLAESPNCPHSDCNALFATSEAKKKHVNTVHKRPGVACEKCGKLFQSAANLREHMQLVHEKRSLDVKCTECDMIFINRQNRNRHLNQMHYPDKFRCKTCQRSYGNAHQLRRHDLVHSGERNFSCDEEDCDRKFKRKQDLLDHKRVHTGEKSFACQYCSYKGTTNELLYHHKRRRHRAEFDEERREKDRSKVKVSDDLLVGKTA